MRYADVDMMDDDELSSNGNDYYKHNALAIKLLIDTDVFFQMPIHLILRNRPRTLFAQAVPIRQKAKED